MCKDRLRRWNCRKNISKQHVNYMVLKYSERQRLGKETAFQFQGKEQSLHQLGAYWQRHIESVKNLPVGESPPTPKDLICLTPPPVPIVAPDELHYQHRFLRAIQDYCLGNFETGLWSIETGDSYYSLTTDRLVNDLHMVIELTRAGDSGQAQKMLRLASPMLKEAVFYHGSILITVLARTKQNIRQCRDREVHASFTNFLNLAIEEMKSSFEAENPLCLILEGLTDIIYMSVDLCRRLWECMVNIFIDKTSFSCSTTLISQYNALVLVETDSLAAIIAQEQLVSRCKRIHDLGNASSFIAQSALALCFCVVGRYQEAEDQQLQAVAELKLSRDPTLMADYIAALTNLSHYQHMNGKLDLAEATQREAIQVSWIFRGKTDSRTLTALRWLKDFLTDTSRFDALEEVNTQIAEVMQERELQSG